MKKGTKKAILSLLLMGVCANASAAFDENLENYTLDSVLVQADRIKNEFGDTITEQSYYRTGGDVKVITREEIDKRHYLTITDAIKRIPGVTFQGPGYRGGEYGYSNYRTKTAINGDQRVIVLIDGRRVDNAASTMMGSDSARSTKSLVDLDQVVNMDNVEKIEVVKGPSASAYGSDAMGGVINIITRKGGDDAMSSVDVSVGSWGKKNIAVNTSGSVMNQENILRYYVSAERQQSGNTEYHDNLTNKDYTYRGTSFKEEGLSIRLDNDFSEKQSLRVWYNYKYGKDSYPITAPNYLYYTPEKWKAIIDKTEAGTFGEPKNPGYRSLFVLDALSGSYNEFRHNDVDVVYTFNKDNGMESFVRIYNQHHKYAGLDRYPEWFDAKTYGYVPFPDSAEWPEFLAKYKFPVDGPTTFYTEIKRGVQVQWAKQFENHGIIASVGFDNNSVDKMKYQRKNKVWEDTSSKRKTVSAYIQDKIQVTDNWVITPSLRYASFSTFTNTDAAGVKTSGGKSASIFTPSLQSQVMLDDTASLYMGVTNIYRPSRQADYTTITPNGKPLEDERGIAWVLGARKVLTPDTTIAVNYNLTKMSNAIARYSVINPQTKVSEAKAVNAKENKQSFNITIDHKYDKNWTVGFSYSHLNDEWKAKDGMQFDPAISLNTSDNVNAMINELRPANHYALNVSYEKGKLYTGVLMNLYNGLNRMAYTKDSFLVIDWNINYQIADDTTAYLVVNNVTNEGWENAYSIYNGMGAYPQPGRHVLVGVKHQF